MNTKTIEEAVSQAILQQTESVKIAGREYEVAPPTVATLIMASELIARLPAVELNAENILPETLYIAKDCRVLGEIIAVLILGAKNLKATRVVDSKRFFGLLTKRVEVEMDAKAELAREIIENLSPRELNTVMVTLLQKMHIADFFGTTTSLIEINLLRRTREVVTTASGHR